MADSSQHDSARKASESDTAATTRLLRAERLEELTRKHMELMRLSPRERAYELWVSIVVVAALVWLVMYLR